MDGWIDRWMDGFGHIDLDRFGWIRIDGWMDRSIDRYIEIHGENAGTLLLSDAPSCRPQSEQYLWYKPSLAMVGLWDRVSHINKNERITTIFIIKILMNINQR